MSIFEPFGAPTFGLRRVRIAKNNLDGTFGAAIKVPSVVSLTANVTHVSAQLRGDDVITATQAIRTGGTVSFQMGSVDLRVLAILLDIIAGTGGTGANSYKRLRIGAQENTYFGVIGQANAAEGTGAVVIFIPKIKVLGDISLGMQDQQFAQPTFQGDIVPDPAFPDETGEPTIMDVILYKTAPTESNLTLPPTLPLV